MNFKFFPVLFIIWINVTKCVAIRYDNYSLYKATPQLRDHVTFFKNVETKKYIELLYWTRPSKAFAEVQFMVKPEDHNVFLERTKHFNIEIELVMENIQAAFDAQKVSRYERNNLDSFTWDGYHTIEDIYLWLTDLSTRHQNILYLESIGKSAESRDILAVTIKRSATKSSVLVECGIHGTEWISVEFATYLIHQLATAEPGNILYPMVEQYMWYVLPIVNPDGFSYNQNYDRLWRKNRRMIEDSVGVDLNRNFDYSFGKFDSSDNPHSSRYCGPQPFSEPETRALVNFINRKADGLKFYFDIHAYGQQLMIPYSDRVQHLSNFKEMENYCKQAALDMFNLYGKTYEVGTAYDTSGLRISGNSASWVKKNLGLRYVVTFLLRDTGTYGYALPSNQIIPACQEGVLGLTKIMTAKPKRLNSNLFSSAHNIKILFYVHVFNFVILKCMM